MFIWISLFIIVYIGPEKPQWGVANYVYIFFYTQNAAVLDHELILTYKSYTDVEATN